eukprot:gene6693-13568_t
MEALRLFKVAREYLTPVLQESAFIKRGMLTPEEFVIAGDQLVHACPTWSWSGGEPSKLRPYLPADKQFLMTKGVPSYRRVTEMNADEIHEQMIETGLTSSSTGKNEDWCAPELMQASDDSRREIQLESTQTIDRSGEVQTENDPAAVMSTEYELSALIDENHFSSNKFAESPQHDKQQQEHQHVVVTSNESSTTTTNTITTTAAVAVAVDPVNFNNKAIIIEGEPSSQNDIDNDNDNDMVDESLAFDSATVPASAAILGGGSSMYLTAEAPDEEENATLLSRRYDITITYDNYYRTPRVWLFGFDENGVPLKPEAVFQDIMTDYAHRTVTLDPHPHLSRPHASIHPCQHGAAMKRIIDELVSGGKIPTVDQYMFIFLKFIQSVVPTIEYDYTMDVRVSAAKPK